MTTLTAHLVAINVGPSRGITTDILEVRDESGEVVGTVELESSEDEQPYLDALAAAGFPGVAIVDSLG